MSDTQNIFAAAMANYLKKDSPTSNDKQPTLEAQFLAINAKLDGAVTSINLNFKKLDVRLKKVQEEVNDLRDTMDKARTDKLAADLAAKLNL